MRALSFDSQVSAEFEIKPDAVTTAVESNETVAAKPTVIIERIEIAPAGSWRGSSKSNAPSWGSTRDVQEDDLSRLHCCGIGDETLPVARWRYCAVYGCSLKLPARCDSCNHSFICRRTDIRGQRPTWLTGARRKPAPYPVSSFAQQSDSVKASNDVWRLVLEIPTRLLFAVVSETMVRPENAPQNQFFGQDYQVAAFLGTLQCVRRRVASR